MNLLKSDWLWDGVGFALGAYVTCRYWAERDSGNFDFLVFMLLLTLTARYLSDLLEAGNDTES